MENKQILSNLVSMLKEHYTYPEEVDTLITHLGGNDVEETCRITLMAFGLFGKKRNVQPCAEDETESKTSSTSNTVESDNHSTIVHIDYLHNKMVLLKAIMDVTKCGLKKAKDLADSIVTIRSGQYSYTEFEVGPKGKFSQPQWEHISKQVSEQCNIEWRFV